MTADHRPRKRFGQNFLRDHRIIEAILTAADLHPTDAVLEIGPGQGALTERLLERVDRLQLMEIDRDLAAGWQQRATDRLQVHVGDALRLDWPALLTRPPYKLVANLPYNISSQVLFKMLAHRQLFSCFVLMFQKEVADRLRAAPATAAYGALSVLFQQAFAIRSVVQVPPSAFIPAPKVWSEVLHFTPWAQPQVVVADEVFFHRVVKAAFAQRRKTLRNCLQAAGFAPADIDRVANETAIDAQRRGETLNLSEFAALSQALAPYAPAS
ncbi:MAG: 16S rRNA (adenine(1518)-N(6)/adenine(1519)-N(6))-dimethyltransferase RsmA [Desulfuromonas thiophila]|nr:16S rRNA (adenine(1518)-N(6)/adenine(1519)-N(6))-dimethyltransferase RsmA [Desulfuromonas thiophila]